MKNLIFTLLLVCSFSALFAQKRIAFLHDPNVATQQVGIIAAMQTAGYTVDVSYTPFDFVALGDYDLIVVSRGVSSGSFLAVNWNPVAKPVLVLSPFCVRDSRMKLINGAVAGPVSMATNPHDQITNALPVKNTDGTLDAVFSGVSTGSAFPMYVWDYVYVNYTESNWATDHNTGKVLAKLADDAQQAGSAGAVIMARWLPNTESYTGAGIHIGYRSYIDTGVDDTSVPQNVIFDNYTPTSLKLIMNEVAFLLNQEIATTYKLTVVSGTGSGSYTHGVVNIAAAAPPSGYVFDKWTGDVTYVADVNDPTTTVNMPAANISVTATYLLGTDPNPIAASGVPTFNCISLYWGPSGGSSSNECQVQYRPSGTNTWKQGLSMWYDSRSPAEYRGSIMNLTPNTNYEIKLTLLGTGTTANFYCKTWTEDFPVASTVSLPATSSSTLTVANSGTADGYILYAPTGSTATIDMNRSTDSDCIFINPGVHHVIIRGLTLKNPGRFGINLGDGCHDIIVDQCDISGWGRIDSHNETITDSGTKLGLDQDGAIHCNVGNSYDCTVYKLIVQYCYIHDPYYDTNPWTQEVTSDNGGKGNHPHGPTAIYLRGPIGNNVFRYNDIVGNSTHRFNDPLGGNQNNSKGWPGADSDINGNYIANYCDDGIESDGWNMNVRIWGNLIEHGGVSAISACSSIKGPLYAFRNVSGDRIWLPAGNTGGVFAKMSDYNGAGQQNWFHNTIRKPNGASQGISVSGDYSYVNYCTSKANIWDCTYPIYSKDSPASTNSFDYDHCTGTVRSYSGAEAHKTTGTPVYETGTNALAAGSPGYGAAPLIYNINDMYADPDMGAEQHGVTTLYGRINLGQITNADQLLNKDASFSVFPNPVTGILTINGENSTGAMPQIEFYNLTGQKVLQVQDVTFPCKADISSFTKGIYLIKVLSGNKCYIEKVVKE